MLCNIKSSGVFHPGSKRNDVAMDVHITEKLIYYVLLFHFEHSKSASLFLKKIRLDIEKIYHRHQGKIIVKQKQTFICARNSYAHEVSRHFIRAVLL